MVVMYVIIFVGNCTSKRIFKVHKNVIRLGANFNVCVCLRVCTHTCMYSVSHFGTKWCTLRIAWCWVQSPNDAAYASADYDHSCTTLLGVFPFCFVVFNVRVWIKKVTSCCL